MTDPTEATIEPTESPGVGPSFDGPASGPLRQMVEFLVVLCLGLMTFRTFAAEAYIVPTGSMAPTLLGEHRKFTCTNCDFPFVLGLDEGGHGGRPACPNCGETGLDDAPAVDSNGDRVLVQKFLYDVRRPRRWEVAVFQFPGDTSQAYVKRVVGLPGETVRIAHGDVWIDGEVARKSLAEQRAMRVAVHDHNYVPKDSDRAPRFVFRRGRPSELLATGWRAEGTAFVHDPVAPPLDLYDWVDYRHWAPERGGYGPVRDFIAYNGVDGRGDFAVSDLMVAAIVRPGPDARKIAVRIDSGSDRFVVEVPVGPGSEPEVRRNGRRLTLVSPRPGLSERPGAPVLLEASVMDRRLTVALDGVLLFAPIDYDDPRLGPGPGQAPIGIGVQGGAFTLEDVRVYRDVYYTTALAFAPLRAHGVDSPHALGPDEFFVLGDNSPISNDSRFWPGSPVVAGELFLGKPFLVHLPGQVVPLRLFGRSLYWVPDPREIRYIR